MPGQRITTPVKFYFNVPKETIAQSNWGRKSEKKEIHLPYSSFPSEMQYKELNLSLSTANRATEWNHMQLPLASVESRNLSLHCQPERLGVLACRMGSTGSLNLALAIFPMEISSLQSFTPNWQSPVKTRGHTMLLQHHNGAVPHSESQSILHLLSHLKSQGQPLHSSSESFCLSFKQTPAECSLILTHTDMNSLTLDSLSNNSLQKPKWFLLRLHSSL